MPGAKWLEPGDTVIRTRVRRLRRDGVIQRYHTTAKRMRDRGLEYDDGISAWVDFQALPEVPTEIGEEPELPELEPYLVTFYTDYKGDIRITRFEVRLNIRAYSPQDAISRGMTKAIDSLDPGYLAFLDSMGVFDENKSADRVSEKDFDNNVQFFRYPKGGKRGEARKFRIKS